jgi:hypothetical protein
MQKSLFVSVTITGASLMMGLFSATSAEAATLSHLYNLNGTLTDSLGGPSLVSNDGTIGAGGYTFDANEGPSLSNAVTQDNYSILMDFSISDTDGNNGYKKLIDFNNLAADTGVYNYLKSLTFYPGPTGTMSTFVAGTLARLVITRDAGTKNFVAYVNGLQQIAFTDTGDAAVFDPLKSNIIQFLRDDTATSGREASAGLLTKIAIYDGAVTGQDVFALGAAGDPIGSTPVPTPALLPGLIGLGLGVLKKRKAELTEASPAG